MTAERRRDTLIQAAWITVPIAVLVLAFGLLSEGGTPGDADGTASVAPPASGERAHPGAGFPAIQARPASPKELAGLVDAAWNGKHPDISGPAAKFWRSPAQGVYVAGRANGRRLYHVWERSPGTVAEVLQAAIQGLRTGKGAGSEVLEVFIATDRREHSPASKSGVLRFPANSERGVRGLELEWKGKVKSFSPTLQLARNRKPKKQISMSLKDWGLTDEEFAGGGGRLRTIGGVQYLVQLGKTPGTSSAVEMYRGNELVKLSDVTAESTRRFAERGSGWMRRALMDDGRFVYKYWPSPGDESTSNNMIRQWMASHALGKIARGSGDAAASERSTRNIEYNLGQWYREEQRDGKTLGLIEFDGKVKLGAVGLAALVIAEHPERAKWQSQYEALNRTTEYLWHEDGHFDTFYKKPAQTKEQPNFYPGEALLMWADRYERERDPKLLAQIMQSFRYYREWHLDPAHRNPAFVPWHVRAYTKVWRLTRDTQLREFVFEMSDWLLTMQEWTPTHPDFVGRFHDPKRRQFGPPHASATGVYLEGYIEAWQMAQELGDHERARRYRKAMIGGLRSLMQLQFVDDVDLYYVSAPRLVRGGLRTTTYNNEIRCDNVQHGLMAVLDILGRFAPADYELPAASH